MARETTIKFDFMLERAKAAKALPPATGDMVTKGATTTLNLDPADPGFTAVNGVAPISAGQMIFVDGTGWASLDGMLHMITAAVSATGVVTLATDSSAETAVLADEADIVIQTLVWDHVCLSEFTPNTGAPGEVDVTTMCDTERRTLPGLSSPGTASFTGMFDLTDTGMQALIDAQKDATKRYFVGVSRRGQTAVFHGTVSAFAPGSMTVEAALTYTGSFTLDESPYYFINEELAA